MQSDPNVSNFASKFRQCLAACIATLGIFSLGTVLAWTSPALPDMKSGSVFQNITTTQQSWIGSTVPLGALAGCPIAGIATEIFGRKRTMQIFSIPFTVGWILIFVTNNLYVIYIGRFISGFCGGVFSLACPVFISETAESHIRGTLTSAFQLMLVTGILFTYILGAFVNWSTLAIICGVFPILTGLLLFFVHESPRYLLSKGQESEASKALCWYRGTSSVESVEDELDEVKRSIEESKEYQTSVKNLLKSEILKPLAISLMLMILEQISAFNAVIFYSVEIFSAAKTEIDANLASIIIAVVQVLATIVSTILVDKSGRRVLLIFSEAVMALSFLALGAFFFILRVNEDLAKGYLSWLPITSLIIFIIAFSIGIGPLSWTVMGEILPPNVKGLCSAIATSLVWLSAFVVVFIYNDLIDAIGKDFGFWLFALFSAIGTLLVYAFLPETKGKSLDQIQLLFTRGRNQIL